MVNPQPGQHAPSPVAHPTVRMRTRHRTRKTPSTICTGGSTTSWGWGRVAGRVGHGTCQPRAAALYKGCYIPSALPAHSTRLMNLLTVSNTEYLLKQIT